MDIGDEENARFKLGSALSLWNLWGCFIGKVHRRSRQQKTRTVIPFAMANTGVQDASSVHQYCWAWHEVSDTLSIHHESIRSGLVFHSAESKLWNGRRASIQHHRDVTFSPRRLSENRPFGSTKKRILRSSRKPVDSDDSGRKSRHPNPCLEKNKKMPQPEEPKVHRPPFFRCADHQLQSTEILRDDHLATSSDRTTNDKNDIRPASRREHRKRSYSFNDITVPQSSRRAHGKVNKWSSIKEMSPRSRRCIHQSEAQVQRTNASLWNQEAVRDIAVPNPRAGGWLANSMCNHLLVVSSGLFCVQSKIGEELHEKIRQF